MSYKSDKPERLFYRNPNLAEPSPEPERTGETSVTHCRHGRKWYRCCDLEANVNRETPDGPYRCSGADDHLPDCGGTCGTMTSETPGEGVMGEIDRLEREIVNRMADLGHYESVNELARIAREQVERARLMGLLDEAQQKLTFEQRDRAEKAEGEVARLREALGEAGETIHSEFCGIGHHTECEKVTTALRGAKETE